MERCKFCDIEVEYVDGVAPIWCSVNCKKNFYLKYYVGNSDVRIWEIEFDKEFRQRQKRVLNEIKESGLSFSEFFKSLGNFKEDTD